MVERVGFSPEIERGNGLIRRVLDLERYERERDRFDPIQITTSLIGEMEELVNALPNIENPLDLQDLYTTELKRRLEAEKSSLSIDLMTELPSYEQVVIYNGIPREDIEALEPWLAENRDRVIEVNLRKFERTSKEKDRRKVHLGVDEIRSEAQNVAIDAIEKLIGLMSQEFGVSEAKASFPRYTDSWDNRSNYNWISYSVLFGTGAMTYINRDGVLLDVGETIGLVGHEFYGHARHHAITESSPELPEFLKIRTNFPTNGSSESVAQYFESRFFDILKLNPEGFNKLAFPMSFDEAYQRYLEDKLLSDYRLKLFWFSIWVLATSTKDNAKMQQERLQPYTIEPSWPRRFISSEQNNWDSISGRLMPFRISELRYVANPVKRIMTGLTPEQTSDAEKLILKGFWMPQGLEDYVKFNLQV